MIRPSHELPRVLVIDDIFGRAHAHAPNEERADLCGNLLLRDITDDEPLDAAAGRIPSPLAQAVFCRAQRPVAATIGDVVENDLEGCLQTIRNGWSHRGPGVPPWALVLLDLCFNTGPVTATSHERTAGVPEGRPADARPESYFGLRILEAIRQEFPDLPVLVLSGEPQRPVRGVVDARGALGFIGSSDPTARDIFKDALWTHGLIPADQNTGIVGYSRNLLLSLRAARRGSASRNLLIRGESGTGKELLARYVHDCSRPGKPYVKVNAGGLSVEQHQSELMGHVKGAYTDASREKPGLIVEANGGDLFLDEIATMPAQVQRGLLRVLESREVRPLGAEEKRVVEVDVRFLFATNEDIEGLALLGQFRQDFLERLRYGGTISLPPLGERREDIPLLVERFLREAIREQNEMRERAGRPRVVVGRVTPEAIDLLCANDWPGNVRGLAAAVKKAATDHPGVESLHPHHFERQISHRVHIEARLPLPSLPPPQPPVPVAVADVLAMVDRFDFQRLTRTDLQGTLPRVEASFGRFTARLLDAALAATSRPTAEAPEGEIIITPAIRHLRGLLKLETSKAADDVKKILAEPTFQETASLRHAYENAVKLRPTNPKKGRRGEAAAPDQPMVEDKGH
jgi:DNA-binding NtrC family response regulator